MSSNAAVRNDSAKPWDLAAGEYSYRNAELWLRLPNGSGPSHLAGKDVRNSWSVIEHEDDTISVSPSILDGESGWHGFLEKGIWREV